MWRWILIAVLCLACLGGALVAVFRTDVRGPIGTRLRYDDFEFDVLSVERRASIGEVRPHGEFRVVRLEVKNAAKRVDYDTAKHRAVLIDGHGRRYEADPDAVRVLAAARPADARPPAVLHAGEACVSELAFDVPRAEQVELMISWGGSFVDMLDGFVCGDKRIVLE